MGVRWIDSETGEEIPGPEHSRKARRARGENVDDVPAQETEEKQKDPKEDEVPIHWSFASKYDAKDVDTVLEGEEEEREGEDDSNG